MLIGIAIAADKTMYIADGRNIRAVDPHGIIHTLVGHHGHHNHWSPAPCVGAIPAHQAQLQWPTGLTLSPLDGSLHFIDEACFETYKRFKSSRSSWNATPLH